MEFNLKTGKMIVLRNSVDNIFKHTNIGRIKIEGLFLKESVKNWEYIGWSYVEPGKHPEAAYFFYYKTMIDNKIRYVNVKIHIDIKSEVPYAILKGIDMSKIKFGVPNDIETFIKN